MLRSQESHELAVPSSGEARQRQRAPQRCQACDSAKDVQRVDHDEHPTIARWIEFACGMCLARSLARGRDWM